MWTAPARAKIKLHLMVHARRPDGYHALTTVFQTIELADTLTIVEHDGPFTLRCPGSDAPEDDSNLVVRAARALASELGRPEPAGLLVTLDKQVPTQAGLGGGSADAMAALRLLCGIWAVPPDRELLTRVGGRAPCHPRRRTGHPSRAGRRPSPADRDPAARPRPRTGGGARPSRRRCRRRARPASAPACRA